jgi:hypothetical protein
MMLEWKSEEGRLAVAMAGADPVWGPGEVARIRLAEGSLESSLAIAAAAFNDGRPAVDIGERARRAGEYRSALGPVAPNPFVEGTTIWFSPAFRADVALGIYSVGGELVRKLVDGPRPAGPQQVRWDGTDCRGRRVPRGVYFCRVTAGDFSATEKIVLLK